MCRFSKIIYACGHRDVVRTRERHDEGLVDIRGQVVPCEKPHKNPADFTRHCMACSSDSGLDTLPDLVGQDLTDLNSASFQNYAEEYNLSDQKAVMALIVRNESFLWKRAKGSPPIISTSLTHLGYHHSELEIQHQCYLNDEFLSRRLKWRCFQQHTKGQGVDYKVYFEAAEANLNARAALQNFLPTLQDIRSPSTPIGNVGVADAQPSTAPTADATQGDSDELVVRPSTPVSPKSTDSLETIESSSRSCLDTGSLSTSPESDESGEICSLWNRKTDTYQSSHRSIHQAHERLQSVLELDINNDESKCRVPYHYESREKNHGSKSCEDAACHRAIKPQGPKLCQFAKLSEEWAVELKRVKHDNIQLRHELDQERIENSELVAVCDELRVLKQNDQGNHPTLISAVGNLGAAWDRESPESQQRITPFDSPERIAQLAEIKRFLSMRPDAKPLDIWNYANRNEDLIAHITWGTIPIRHRSLHNAKRPGFERDLGVVMVLTDDKWGFRNRFIETWNSVFWNWPVEEYLGQESNFHTGSAYEETHGETYEGMSGRKYEGKTVEQARRLCLGQANITENQEQESEDGGTFPLEGRCGKAGIEVTSAEKLIVPAHQPRRLSRLRTSWTYADNDEYGEVVLTPSIEGDSVAHLLSSPAPHGDFVSSLSSPPPSLGQRVSPLSIKYSTPNIDLEDPTSLAPTRVGQTPSSVSDGSSSIGSVSHCVFNGKGPPISVEADLVERDLVGPDLVGAESDLAEPDSAEGKRLLSQIRELLAMPASKTAQEVSLFIDSQPKLMEAIRKGFVPPKKTSTIDDTHELGQEAIIRVRVRENPGQKFMRQRIIHAIKILDWEEIDSSPLPIRPLLASLQKGPTVGNEEGRVENDAKEECDYWTEITVSENLSQHALMGSQAFMWFRCITPSPLRTSLTRCDADVGVS